jgi:hypothetical protein
MKRRIPRKLKKEVHKILVCCSDTMTITDTSVTQYHIIKIKDGEKINRWTNRTRRLVRKEYRRMINNISDFCNKYFEEGHPEPWAWDVFA